MGQIVAVKKEKCLKLQAKFIEKICLIYIRDLHNVISLIIKDSDYDEKVLKLKEIYYFQDVLIYKAERLFARANGNTFITNGE